MGSGTEVNIRIININLAKPRKKMIFFVLIISSLNSDKKSVLIHKKWYELLVIEIYNLPNFIDTNEDKL